MQAMEVYGSRPHARGSIGLEQRTLPRERKCPCTMNEVYMYRHSSVVCRHLHRRKTDIWNHHKSIWQRMLSATLVLPKNTSGALLYDEFHQILRTCPSIKPLTNCGTRCIHS